MIKRYFLTGLFVLIPIGASVLIVTWLFHFMDSWSHPLTMRLFGHHVPGIGLGITLGIIFLVGAASSNVMGRWLFNLLDHLFLEIPIFRSIYSTTKQMIQLFSPSGSDAFHSVVLVMHPESNALVLGFATHEMELTQAGQKEKRITVYIPTNHVYLGTTYLFAAKDVRRTSISVQDAIQSAISAGATLPKNLTTEPW